MTAAVLVPVTFLVAHGLYNAGETAGFTEDMAASLIEQKIATPADGAETAPETKPKGKPKPAPAAEPVPEPEPA